MSRRSHSLTAQLGALFAMVAIIVFSAVGFFLYQALAAQLQDRDDADLVSRMLQIRHLLEETKDADSIRRDPHRFLDAVSLSRGLLLVIQRDDGEALIQSTAERSFTRAGGVSAVDTVPSSADTRSGALADAFKIGRAHV